MEQQAGPSRGCHVPHHPPTPTCSTTHCFFQHSTTFPPDFRLAMGGESRDRIREMHMTSVESTSSQPHKRSNVVQQICEGSIHSLCTFHFQVYAGAVKMKDTMCITMTRQADERDKCTHDHPSSSRFQQALEVYSGRELMLNSAEPSPR
ncbi:hypothetical protein P7K49_008882 [Saguinus oedipus]|uniref:Uncharacterized protein n=1 Tax=Saguinus oedipus TaxID=9490 RepID=A0ABQ9VZ11_SAGOE|nr:hypothetical protein P7K49_008882 [Saguinus oedipus]